MMTDPFILGVNYWPRRKAMYWWSDFDADEVREEFSLIAELGMKLVRIFLLWDDWQPTPEVVSSNCLCDLGTVCDIAAELELSLDVTFFTGHMSGPNWAPHWLLAPAAPSPSPHLRQLVSGGEVVGGSYRNPFHDPTALAAAELLLETVVGEYRNHPAIRMWNLGNEPDLFAWPASAAAGRRWVHDMTALVKDLDPAHPVTCGLHIESLQADNGLRVSEVFAETDVAVMHAYPMYLSWARQPLDSELVPFTCALVTALCGKPTLMEEWGGCTAPPGQASQLWNWDAYGRPRRQFMASETDLADYLAAVLPKLEEVGASGALLWCFADYHQSLWEKPPCKESRHERFFGLVRPDGTLKPHAEVVRRFAAAKPTVVTSPPRTVTLDVTPEEYYRAPREHLIRLYRDYLERYES